MDQRKLGKRGIRISLLVGTAFAVCGIWATVPAGAQGAPQVEPQGELQDEQQVGITIGAGFLEIAASNQSDTGRAISVRLGDQVMAEFKTDFGMALDLLATYAGAGATYVVLRTNLSQGGCGGADVYVLTAYPDGENGPHVEVSPILQKCMGEVPAVCFTYEESEGEIVSVAGYDLRNDTWVPEAGVEEEHK